MDTYFLFVHMTCQVVTALGKRRGKEERSAGDRKATTLYRVPREGHSDNTRGQTWQKQGSKSYKYWEKEQT